MNKYENGKIYKIEAINGEEGDIYIGSTTQKYLCNRMVKHRSTYKQYNKDKKSRIRSYDLFDKYGVDNCVITLIEIVSCQCKEELKARERYYIQSLKCVNKNIPLRSAIEYYQDNKEAVDNYRKEWRSNNKEKTKTYREDNKDKLQQNRKLYYEENNEKIKQKRKVYYQTTKSKDSETFVCECGSKCWVIRKNRHFQSKKHQDFINRSK